jgi:predicted Zn finger-like uncharacterized protein
MARFAVMSHEIGKSGRRVRCGKCKHDWFQKLPQELYQETAPDPAEINLMHEGSNLPVIVKNSKDSAYTKLALYCSFLFLIFTLSIVNSNKLIPFLGIYYNSIGIYDDSGISLSDTSAEKITSASNKTLKLKGRIVNNSKIAKAIPNLRITLLSSNQKKLQSVMLNSNDAPLSPGEGIDFENKIPNLPDNVDKVIMDIGNAVNLAAR